MQTNTMHGCTMFVLGEMKWSPRQASAELLATAHARPRTRGVPPLVRGEVMRALFVPTMPRTRPKSLPRDVRRIDAATLLAVVGGDEA